VGVRLTDSALQAVLTDFRANVIDAKETRIANASPAFVVDAIADTVASLSIATDHLAAVGLCLGGQIANGDTVRYAPYLDWSDVPIRELIASRLNCRVVVENDLTALTNAEHWFGAGRGSSQFAVVTIGAGVGLGVVTSNSMLQSKDFGLGLAGHIPLDSSGPVCPRGHHGCAKSMLTTSGVAGWLSDRLGFDVSWESALELRANGQADARQVFREAASALGTYLSIVANIVQPDKIVLTGEGVDIALLNRGQVDAALDDLRNPLADPVEVVIHPTEPYMWARGAAVASIQDFVRRG
jgi:predicted NBD/HSP70 family sugar kinase